MLAWRYPSANASDKRRHKDQRLYPAMCNIDLKKNPETDVIWLGMRR